MLLEGVLDMANVLYWVSRSSAGKSESRWSFFDRWDEGADRKDDNAFVNWNEGQCWAVARGVERPSEIEELVDKEEFRVVDVRLSEVTSDGAAGDHEVLSMSRSWSLGDTRSACVVETCDLLINQDENQKDSYLRWGLD